MHRKRYALVGLGNRHEIYRDGIAGELSACAELVALCDRNPGRLELARQWMKAHTPVSVAGYAAADFDRMIADTHPDAVIVCSPDHTHDDYICRAMEQGCDVICEKPLATDAAKCRRILEVKRRTGRRLTVTFNCRYSPPRAQVKDLLMSGVIGNILSVSLEWLLDVRHGADYFRRWHRRKENSGGLLVHKATHHFDLVNWWLGTVPETVFATGHRLFYTPQTADRYGLTARTERCHTCPEAGRCRFALRLDKHQRLRELFLETEHHDGYFRDQCVFSDAIDIEDNMNVVVNYRNRVKLSYSLNAFLPWEGYHICFNGTRGRLEHKWEEQVRVCTDGSVPGALGREGAWIRIYPHWSPAYQVETWQGEGGHGGGDPVMLRYLLDPDHQPPDPYLRAADERAGAWSILTGIAGNRSIAEGRAIRIDELVPDIGMPDEPPMPSPDEALSF